jgi:hypothetical protein
MHSWKKYLFWSWKFYKNMRSKVSFLEQSFHKCLMVITFFPFSLNIARKLKPKLSLFYVFFLTLCDLFIYLFFLLVLCCLNKFSYALICQGGLEQFPNNVIYQHFFTHAHSAIINIVLWNYKRWFHHYILVQFFLGVWVCNQNKLW